MQIYFRYTRKYKIRASIVNIGSIVGEQGFDSLVGYASSIVDISWISDNMSDMNINVEDNSFVLPSAAFDLFEIILSLLSTLFNQFLVSKKRFLPPKKNVLFLGDI